MRQTSPMNRYSPGLAPEQKEEINGFVPEPRESCTRSHVTEIPFGALHVDAAGIVLEHRQADARALFPAARIIGRQFVAIAPWATEPGFLSALKTAIDRSNVSYHFDFKESDNAVERSIHVNILASGNRSAWVFISDKTLPLMS